MGRKKLEPRVELVTDAPLDAQGLEKEVNALAKLEAAFTRDQRQATLFVGERLGLRKALRMVSKLLTVTDVLDLQRIKESKIYKGYTHIGEGGKSQAITTWADYCKLVEGRSAEAIDLDILNLRQLGEDWFDAMRQIGIGPGRMREIRKLPDDAQTALLEAARDGDKETLLDLAEELISKHAKEKEELQKRVEEAELNYEVRGKLITDKSQQIDELQLTVQKLQRHVHSEPAPERSKQLQAEVALIGIDLDLAGLQGKLRKAFAALQDDIEATGFDHREFMTGVIGKLERTLGSIRSEFYLRKMDNSEEEFPWIDQLVRESHD